MIKVTNRNRHWKEYKNFWFVNDSIYVMENEIVL